MWDFDIFNFTALSTRGKLEGTDDRSMFAVKARSVFATHRYIISTIATFVTRYVVFRVSSVIGW